MDEDHLNMEIRKFLKKVVVTSQREIEKIVKGALGAEKLSGSETLNAYMRLRIDAIDPVGHSYQIWLSQTHHRILRDGQPALSIRPGRRLEGWALG